MKLRQQIKRKNLNQEFLKILSRGELPQREIDILALLIDIDAGWKPRSPREIKNIVSTDNRKYLMAETKINKNNLTKYINILRRKNLILPTETGGWEISRDIVPKVENNLVDITFILDLKNENI
jgi:hypothetical protein